MGSTIRERATARKSYDPPPPPTPQPELVVTMTREQLREEIRAALAEREPEPGYLDDAGMAGRLGTGIAIIRSLLAEGMPHVYVGDRRRYRVVDVDAWLSGRQR